MRTRLLPLLSYQAASLTQTTETMDHQVSSESDSEKIKIPCRLAQEGGATENHYLLGPDGRQRVSVTWQPFNLQSFNLKGAS